MLSVHKLGEGCFVLNTLLVRETVGRNPVAERLLRNMLRFGSRDLASPLGQARPELIEQVGLK
jgi:hypothetical protein